MASENVTKVSSATFASEVLQSDKPVLVDFWAEWCGPCKMLSPLLDEIADEQVDRVKIVKVNVDEEQALAQEYGIIHIPTLIVFKGGEKKEEMVGLASKKVIVEKLAALAA